MTPREVDCLRFIEAFRAGHDYGPSYEEMAEGLGIVSKSGVSRLVHSLARQGRITIDPGLHRSIDIPAERLAA